MKTFILVLCLVSFTSSWADSEEHALKGIVRESSCSGLDSTSEKCVWAYRIPNSCKEQACSKLVIFFAGGAMNCQKAFSTKNSSFGKVLKAYASAGYAATVACMYESLSAADELPVITQVPRVDFLLKAIQGHMTAHKYWTGDELLLTGVSIGASTPVVAMARTKMDDEAWWRGKKKTAACFIAGVYDVPYLDKYFKENSPSCDRMRKDTLCKRYLGQSDCAYPLTPTTESQKDSILQVLPGEYSIHRWKLIECGSANPKPKCAPSGQWIPDAPIAGLCKQLGSANGYQCDFDSMPEASHLACAYETDAIKKCLDWF